MQVSETWFCPGYCSGAWYHWLTKPFCVKTGSWAPCVSHTLLGSLIREPCHRCGTREIQILRSSRFYVNSCKRQPSLHKHEQHPLSRSHSDDLKPNWGGLRFLLTFNLQGHDFWFLSLLTLAFGFGVTRGFNFCLGTWKWEKTFP